MLDTIPPEILAQISYHVSTPSLTPPVSLLRTSKHFYHHLSPVNNPNLYAQLYKDNFDISAARRRLGRRVGNEGLRDELERRVRGLERLAKLRIDDVTEEDMWVLYLLIIEHGQSSYLLQFLSCFVKIQLGS